MESQEEQRRMAGELCRLTKELDLSRTALAHLEVDLSRRERHLLMRLLEIEAATEAPEDARKHPELSGLVAGGTELQQLTLKIRDLERNVTAVEGRERELLGRLASREAELERARGAMAELQAQQAEIGQAEFEHYQARERELLGQVAAKAAQVQELSGKLADLQARQAGGGGGRDAALREKEELVGQLASRSQEVTSLTARLAAKELEQAEYARTAKADLLRLESKQTENAEKAKAYLAELEAKTIEVANLKGKLAQAEAREVDFQSKQAQRSSTRELELQQRLAAKAKEAADLSNKLSASEALLAENKSMRAVQERELLAKLQAKTKEAAQLRAQLDDLGPAAEASASRVQGLEEAAARESSLTALLAEAQARNRSLEEQLLAFEDKVSQLLNRLN